jgi:hypothetical protein
MCRSHIERKSTPSTALGETPKMKPLGVTLTHEYGLHTHAGILLLNFRHQLQKTHGRGLHPISALSVTPFNGDPVIDSVGAGDQGAHGGML